MRSVRSRRERRGAALVEFALVCLQLLLVMFATFEFARMAVVYNTLANAARVGTRFAIVHGSTNEGTGPLDGPSGPLPGSTGPIETVVQDFARIGLLDLARLDITVTYQNSNNDPGSWVEVRLAYDYDPFVLLPVSVQLGAKTRGVITF